MATASLWAISMAAWAALFVAPAIADARADAWVADIAAARDQFLAKDLSYSPAVRATAGERLNALAAHAASLRDQEIVAELARVAALAGNAHTRAYVLRNRGYWRRYPIRIWRFTDGWRVIAAQGEATALLGKRITRIAGKPIAAALGAVRPLYAGNAQWADYMATYTLTSPDALLGTGIIAGEGPAEFEAVDGTRAALSAMPFTPRAGPEENWWFLSPAHPVTAGWTHALSTASPLPAYLVRVNKNFWFGQCGGALYAQFNRSQDSPAETVAAFGARLLDAIARETPEKLIIDLRFNTGGDLTLGHPLFKQLSALPLAQKRGALAVIVGPTTFSAGIFHAAWLKQETKARFVGTPPGDELDFWSEGGNVVLPNSRILMHYADRKHAYGLADPGVDESLLFVDLNIDNLTPDLAAPLSWREYATGRDPAAQRILGHQLDCP